ncbi:DUF616 domain-containing protein [Flaviramulus sp. BrNp1-15]|uniref:glycosyltransferase domain-containing protein n=1 Tax=Flaviramulus sp. BrNp1-15 TaxID=2916754 RepID=UPI001EE9633F|nr:glycosyltransferase domain-containing protein [Flaviramulus sp. BrNp1-15]ULC60561.1 DUF616 domain-containing protein [Flaviramulus sp. BrNp1-15]
MNKIAIYTAIFGDKDILKPPLNFKEDNNVDYYLITDNVELDSYNYQLILKKPIYDDITKNARFYKINGLEIFEDYDFVIWHDANLQIIHNKIIDSVDFVKHKSIAFFKHPVRNCIYDEAIKCIYKEKDHPFKILKQIFQYYKFGIKNKIGLYETSIVIQNNKLICKDFLNLWWSEIINKSRRDQLSLPYSLKVFNLIPAIIPGDREQNMFSLYNLHNHSKYNFLSIQKPKKYRKLYKILSIKAIRGIKRLNK